MRDVCISAGLEQRCTVLLVSKDNCGNPLTWKSIQELMDEGMLICIAICNSLLVGQAIDTSS